jgi:hypothetical protein
MQNRPCRGGHHGAAIFCGIHCSQVRAVVVCYELLLAPKKTNSPGWARAIHPGQGPTASIQDKGPLNESVPY